MVQIAPWAEQSVVAFRAMSTSAPEPGVMVISQRTFLPRLQTAGDLRPRQARLLLEQLQSLREVLGEDVGSAAVAIALSRHRASPPCAQPTTLSNVSASAPVLWGSPRAVRSRSVRLPYAFIHVCLLSPFLYRPGPLTVSSTPPDSFPPFSVQIAPWAEQSVVAFRAMSTSAPEPGVTVISQRTFLPGSRRRT